MTIEAMEFVSPVCWCLIDFIFGVRSCLNSLGKQEEDIQFRKTTIFLTRTLSCNVHHYKALNKYNDLMNNCDKLKICARIKISLAIFIMREVFADDCVYVRLIK